MEAIGKLGYYCIRDIVAGDTVCHHSADVPITFPNYFNYFNFMFSRTSTRLCYQTISADMMSSISSVWVFPSSLFVVN